MKIIFIMTCMMLCLNSKSQNVGIGTAAPAGKLQINHRSANNLPGLLLMDSTASYSGLLRFKNLSSTKHMQLWGYYDGIHSRDQYLDVSSDSTFIATFRGNGNFGLGVLTPSYRLDVNGIVNSNSEYRLSGKTVFRWSDLVAGLYRNFFAGDSAGVSNTTGFANTFAGGGAGRFNTQGWRNCFLGSRAGYQNVAGVDNTFVGCGAGQFSTGSQNTFLGSGAGFSNTTGFNNVFLGLGSGGLNTTGFQNIFIGASSGVVNEDGTDNIFIGQSTGETNISGHFNTVIGAFADLGTPGLTNANAIGYLAYATENNTLILGSISGVNDAAVNTRVGIGTTTPAELLDVAGNVRLSGEINRTSTGLSNLLPVAYGNVSTAGGINSGTGNFSVTRTAAGSYTIDITGHSYSYATYATVVTIINTPLVATTDSFSGNLLVRLYNLSGLLTDGGFQFVVYKQ